MANTTIENLTVKRRKVHNLRSRNYSSETQAYNTQDIVYAIPSISKKDGVTDGEVHAEVKVRDGKTGGIKLWVTQTAAEVGALDGNLEGLTVKRKKVGIKGKNYASEAQYYSTANITYAIPSISKKDGVTDGEVHSEVFVNDEEEGIKLWCTNTVADVEALNE